MNILLDTHVWVWCHLRPKKLSRPANRLIEEPRNDLWLSSASVWEFVTLSGKGRFGPIPDPFAWIDEAMLRLPMRDAPLTRAIAMEAGRFRMPHNDPIDYLIVATARVLELTLVTADQNIIASKATRIVEAV